MGYFDADAGPAPRVVGVPGSLRDESVTRVAVARALEAAGDAGAETDLLDLREFDLPVYDGDRPEAGDSRAVRERIRAGNAVVLGTPVYHHSYSSPLRAVLDYCRFDDFDDTLVGVVAVAGGGAGGGPSEALSHLRDTVHGLRAHLHTRHVVVTGASDAVADGAVADPDLADRLADLGGQLVDHAPRAAAAPADD